MHTKRARNARDPKDGAGVRTVLRREVVQRHLRAGTGRFGLVWFGLVRFGSDCFGQLCFGSVRSEPCGSERAAPYQSRADESAQADGISSARRLTNRAARGRAIAAHRPRRAPARGSAGANRRALVTRGARGDNEVFDAEHSNHLRGGPRVDGHAAEARGLRRAAAPR
jgi:hypothetical protein